MITVTILNIFAVLFAYLARYKRKLFLFEVSFGMIFLFLALRYDYGNDYSGYLQNFLLINQVKSIDYFDISWGFEPGWIFLCRLFEPLGFFAMTAVLALFNCFVYYRFIKKYVPTDYYFFAVFFYVFNPYLMLVHSSAMRQSIAICLFLFSIDYIYKKKALRYFLCIGLASLFHMSALILLPVYLLGLYDWKINKFTAVSIFTLFFSMFVFGDTLLPHIKEFIFIYFKKYEIYGASAKIGTGLGLLFNSFIFALILYYERSQKAAVSLLFKISIIGYFIIPLTLLIMMLGRVSMYFQPVTLAVYPIIFLNMRNTIFRNTTYTILVFITMYEYINFFQSDIWKVAFGTYHTIFSAPQIY